MDHVDDNNSVMVYGPLEPDETSKVEIACSEIVSEYEDEEEIRTLQPRFVPLPIEYPERLLIGPPEGADKSSSEGQGHHDQSDSSPFGPLLIEYPHQLPIGPPKGADKNSSKGQGHHDQADSPPFVPPEETWQSPVSGGGQRPKREHRVWLPSPTQISVQVMWWGFRIYLSHPVLEALNKKPTRAEKRTTITTALKWILTHIPIALLPPQMRLAVAILSGLVPILGYIGGLILSAIKSYDKGYGVVLTATWLLPFVLIPRTLEAKDFPQSRPSPR